MTTAWARWLGQLRVARLRAAIVLVVIVFALPHVVVAQVVSRAPDGTVSLSASEVPLRRVLDLLGEITPFEMLVVKGDAGARPVTLTVEKVTPRRAIEQVLESAHVDYIFSGHRLIVLDSVFSGTIAPVKNAAVPPATVNRERPLDGEAAEPPPVDKARAEEEARVKQNTLEQALSPPAVAIPPMAPVDLPFPGPDGRTPLSVIKAPQQPVQALPFPAAPGTQLRATPPPRDPMLLNLINALSPIRRSGG